MEDSSALAQDLLKNDIHVQATYRLTEALYASEKRMRRRIELLSEVIFETDGEGRLTFLNLAWTDTLGYEVASSLGAELRDFVVAEDRELLNAERAQVRFRHVEGNVVWMDLSVAALEDGGRVGALHDVTQQRLAQAELSKLSLVASYTDSLVVITDGEGRAEWVNLAFTRRTGYSLEEMFGRKPGAVLQGPGTDPATKAMLHEGLRGGRSLQCEILNYTKRGQAYWVEIHISPIRNSKGQVERYVAIQTDITALRRAQEELKAAKEAAESASEAKTQFLATISHEMRTPLNVILGTTELALETEREPGAAHSLTRIHDNAETLLGLISDLLDVSKIEAGQFEWERVAFPLRTRLRQALAPVAERAIRKGLDFQVVIDDQLPETVTGDPTRLRQIVVNLGENAVKFTDSGFVRFEAAGGAGGLRIRVVDSGAGISESAIPYIFDRFFQGDGSTTRRKGGAGLGLSIVKSLVDAMGGTVTVRSLPGEGAEFELLLPLEPVVSVPVSVAQPVVLPVDSGRFILVAEDNDDNYVIVQRHLTNQGYRVERAENGVKAVVAAGRTRFDLILMDIEMPEMDGLEATRLIRLAEAQGGGRRVPILALTAHAVMGYRERCLQVGCTGYLPKPVRKQGLLEGVAAALAESQAEPVGL